MVHVYINIKITFLLSHAWTMNSMTDDGKRKLIEYGIAPFKKGPDKSVTPSFFTQCKLADTKLLSGFGSAKCTAFNKLTIAKNPQIILNAIYLQMD